jgi:hypothetical protein
VEEQLGTGIHVLIIYVERQRKCSKTDHVFIKLFGGTQPSLKLCKVFMRYFGNTTVSENTTVSSTLMCLSLTKNCGINTSLSQNVLFLKY